MSQSVLALTTGDRLAGFSARGRPLSGLSAAPECGPLAPPTYPGGPDLLERPILSPDPLTVDLGLAGLGDWTLSRGHAPALPPGAWTWEDDQGTFARRLPGEPERLLLRTDFVGSALISPKDRTILLHDLVDEALAGQWLIDQVAPRLLSHLGDLVVHAGAVQPESGRAILIVGPSRHGKSTLTGFLHQGGWPALGDDAMMIRPAPAGATVRSVYPRLMLRHDSGARLYPSATASSPGGKLSIAVPSGAADVPLAAVFCLGGREGAADCRTESLSPAQACLELLRNSYALDPADRDRASLRLRLAGTVANAVPAFRLTYPRDYARLPEVREAIRMALAAGCR